MSKEVVTREITKCDVCKCEMTEHDRINEEVNVGGTTLVTANIRITNFSSPFSKDIDFPDVCRKCYIKIVKNFLERNLGSCDYE